MRLTPVPLAALLVACSGSTPSGSETGTESDTLLPPMDPPVHTGELQPPMPAPEHTGRMTPPMPAPRHSGGLTPPMEPPVHTGAHSGAAARVSPPPRVRPVR